MKILILNAGSSTQKSCLYDLIGDSLPSHPPAPIWEADIDWGVNNNHGILTVKAKGNKQQIELSKYRESFRYQGIVQMLNTLVSGDTKILEQLSEINIVGHRVVHGGDKYSQATLITPEVKDTIARLIPLAPAHNPAHLEGIEAIEKILGNVPQLAVFDTAFHSKMPPEAATYPIPLEWLDKGIRRYGFHGTSHKYCAQKAAQIMQKPLASLKLITCHLGNGCSLAAIKDGISINTTMGFTPLEGLMMGSRSGSIDPEIPIFLIKEYNLTPEQVTTLLNKKSGFLGVSGVSSDLRTITQAIDEGNQAAKLAFNMFIHRLRSLIGSMLACLGGLDGLIFTAGIGENSALVREKACEGWPFLRVHLDLNKNQSHPIDEDISTPESLVKVLVIHTQEDWAIAQECWEYLSYYFTIRLSPRQNACPTFNPIDKNSDRLII